MSEVINAIRIADYEEAVVASVVANVEKKTASNIWHDMLRGLGSELQAAWRAKGFPTGYPYGDEDQPCLMCKAINQQVGWEIQRTKAAEEKAKAAEKVAMDTLARSDKAIAKARKEAYAASGADNFLAVIDKTLDVHERTIKNITEQTTVVNLPDPTPVTFEKGAITNVVPQPQVNLKMSEGDDDDDEVKAIAFGDGVLAIETDQVEIVNHPTRQGAYFVRRKDAQS